MSGLTINDAEFIYENSDYKDIISIQYIIDRITNGVSSCIRWGNGSIRVTRGKVGIKKRQYCLF